MGTRSSYIVFLFFFLVSCGSETFDTPEEMEKFINEKDNGFKQTKIINGVEYTLQYKPTDLMVKQEAGGKATDVEFKRLRERYNKYLYFTLSMAMNDKELLSNVVRDKAKFGQMVTDLAFGMEEKVHFFTKQNDTLAMTDFIYPRMYGMTNDTSLLIVYPREEKYLKEDYINFTIEDLGLNTGEVRFKIETKLLFNEPQLQFN